MTMRTVEATIYCKANLLSASRIHHHQDWVILVHVLCQLTGVYPIEIPESLLLSEFRRKS